MKTEAKNSLNKVILNLKKERDCFKELVALQEQRLKWAREAKRAIDQNNKEYAKNLIELIGKYAFELKAKEVIK